MSSALTCCVPRRRLGAIRIKVGGHFAGGPLDVDQVADEFGALAEQARQCGHHGRYRADAVR